MVSMDLLNYLKRVDQMTVNMEQLIKKYPDSPKTNIYGAIHTLRKKGYKIISPKEGIYQLLETEPGEAPFEGHRTSPVPKRKPSSNTLNKSFSIGQGFTSKQIPKLPVSDREDYLKLVKQSVYYGMCAEALVRANEFQDSLRDRMMHD